MVGSKQRKRKTPSIPFHQDFCVPTKSDRQEALGEFPGATHAEKTRIEHLRGTNAASTNANANRLSWEEAGVSVEKALKDLNNPRLFKPTLRSVTSMAVPHPKDELDWLAQVPEEGETFEDFVRFHTTRTGRLKKARHWGEVIVLLPIGEESEWTGPDLNLLNKYTQAFFDRPVVILSPAIVKVKSSPIEMEKPGAFAARKKSAFSLNLPNTRQSVRVLGRHDPKSGHSQLQVESLLNELSAFKESTKAIPPNTFCVMGVSMMDLYDGPSDLFCAGMAFGGSAVAVFSFFRYHPHLRMDSMRWFDFGYDETASAYSYYEDNSKEPPHLSKEPPPLADTTEYLRRSAKLLTHELAHLYGVDHCIYNRCLMNGTGHLVEDFAAPCHLCGVCLRKLQWRLGFSVTGRYMAVLKAFTAMNMTKESAWVSKQVESTSK